MFDMDVLNREVSSSDAAVETALQCLENRRHRQDETLRERAAQRLERAGAADQVLRSAREAFWRATEYQVKLEELIAATASGAEAIVFDNIKEQMGEAHSALALARTTALRALRDHGYANGLAAQVVAESTTLVRAIDELYYASL